LNGVGERNSNDYIGYVFTPFDAMITAAGFSREVGYNKVKGLGIKQIKREILNIDGSTCWINQKDDIWRNEGVWDISENENPYIKKNDHFTNVNGNKIDFHKDFLSPFIIRYTKEVRKIDPHALIFFEGYPGDTLFGTLPKFEIPDNSVHAAHWYDAATLVTKRPFLRANYDITRDKLVVGKKKVQKMFNKQLKLIKDYVNEQIPTFIGEFGVHYDIYNKKAYKNFLKKPNKAWKPHIKALDMYYNALDENLLHATQWNYTSDNNNTWGDLWNLEDISIFSRDQQRDPDDINSGGRALEGFCRPHLLRCAGFPQKMKFMRKKKIFSFEYIADPSIKEPTLIYIPKIQYPNGIYINQSNHELKMEHNEQILKIWALEKKLITLKIEEI
jgi:hypothetical protein